MLLDQDPMQFVVLVCAYFFLLFVMKFEKKVATYIRFDYELMNSLNSNIIALGFRAPI